LSSSDRDFFLADATGWMYTSNNSLSAREEPMTSQPLADSTTPQPPRLLDLVRQAALDRFGMSNSCWTCWAMVSIGEV
jgi:hypothetical protein